MTAEMDAIERAECNSDVDFVRVNWHCPGSLRSNGHCCDMWEIHRPEKMCRAPR